MLDPKLVRTQSVETILINWLSKTIKISLSED